VQKRTLSSVWDQIRMKYGVYLRLLEAIPADRYHTQPIAGMRSPAELVAHTSGEIVRDIARGVAGGALARAAVPHTTVAAGLRTKADVLAFAADCWKDADAAIARIGDAELAAMVKTPWGRPLQGAALVHVMNDELLHHRGQLYAMARACGAAPPDLWSFAENGPGFRSAG
jgi:uncharacterized damage-inducible protein DinB